MNDDITIVISNKENIKKYFINEEITNRPFTFVLATYDLETGRTTHETIQVEHGDIFIDGILTDTKDNVKIYVNDYHGNKDFFEYYKKEVQRQPIYPNIFFIHATPVTFKMNNNIYFTLPNNEIEVYGFFMSYDNTDFQNKIASKLSSYYDDKELHRDIIDITRINRKMGVFSVIPIEYTVIFPNINTPKMQFTALCNDDLLEKIKENIPEKNKEVHIARIIRRGVRKHDVYVVLMLDKSDVMNTLSDYDEFEHKQLKPINARGTRARNKKSKKSQKSKKNQKSQKSQKNKK